jgi:hypothetical protein
MEINEEKFYPIISKWLRSFIGCQYAGERIFLWGKQPDVLGINFEIRDGIRFILHMVEVKVIDSLTLAYNLIGEMESRIASFRKKNSIFYALYLYLGIYEVYSVDEIKDYVEHRKVGLINLKGSVISLERSPTPIFSNKILSIKDFSDESWIKDRDEAKVFREVSRTIDWWKLKELMLRYLSNVNFKW